MTVHLTISLERRTAIFHRPLPPPPDRTEHRRPRRENSIESRSLVLQNRPNTHTNLQAWNLTHANLHLLLYRQIMSKTHFAGSSIRWVHRFIAHHDFFRFIRLVRSRSVWIPFFNFWLLLIAPVSPFIGFGASLPNLTISQKLLRLFHSWKKCTHTFIQGLSATIPTFSSITIFRRTRWYTSL